MMTSVLVALPFAAGAAVCILRSRKAIRIVLASAALLHFLLVLASWLVPCQDAMGGWMGLDAAGKYFLTTTSLIFLAASSYCIWYLAKEEEGGRTHRLPQDGGMIFISNEPENVFCSCLLFFLGAMTFVCCSRHFGLMWVAIEATTLASAPLIYFHRRQGSLNATWKYVLICSVGIGIALIGNLLLAVAASRIESPDSPLGLETLLANKDILLPGWLRAAFIFFLVGYGTKMGLVPFHSWLPDAHGEAPSPVSSLLSGALLNCAFLGILRAHQVCIGAGVGEFSSGLLSFFGLFSMAYAALFIVAQTDFKRMLAYSSVEHMGIMAFGAGLGAAAFPAAMFHMLNHSLTKGLLFLVAGNIVAAYGSRSVSDVRGMVLRTPLSAVLWIAGILSITGTPPFGIFFSEFRILVVAVESSRFIEAGIFLATLAVVFCAMSSSMIRMVYGDRDSAGSKGRFSEGVMGIVPPAALCALTLLAGAHMPEFLRNALELASLCIGGKP